MFFHSIQVDTQLRQGFLAAQVLEGTGVLEASFYIMGGDCEYQDSTVQLLYEATTRDGKVYVKDPLDHNKLFVF